MYQIYVIWFGWVLWHINHCGLFNAKSSIYFGIKIHRSFYSFVIGEISVRRFSTGGPLLAALWEAAPAGHTAIRWRSLDCKLRQTQDSHWHTARISRGHSHISFHFIQAFPFPTWLLPFIFTGSSCAENLWLTARQVSIYNAYLLNIFDS